MKIGEKLKKGRIEIGMTQEEVSQVLHVSRSTVSSWEVNRTYPDLDMLVSLSDLYDISLDIILREDDSMVQQITNEVKKSKKRRNWIIILCLILIPIVIFLGYQQWRANQVVSPSQVKAVDLELNGEELSAQSEVKATITIDDWYEYSGHWIELNEDKDTILIQFYQKFDISSNKTEEQVTVPINLDDLSNSRIVNIEIIGFNNNSRKNIYELD